MKHPHVVLGVFAIFIYVGGELSVGTAIINFLGQQMVAGFNAVEASKYVSLYWGGLMIWRFMGAVELSEMKKANKQIMLIVIPLLAYLDNLPHHNWHWRWHYGTGDALNNSTHEIDVARWVLGVTWPARVSSNGGRCFFKDDWETPDTETISWGFPEGKTLIWESHSYRDFPIEGRVCGILVYGDKGTAMLGGEDYIIYDKKGKILKQAKGKEVLDPTNTVSASGVGLDTAHVANFIETMRGNQRLNCPIEEGHNSVTLLHLGNIAWRVGRELYCDPATGHILNDTEAMKLWQRDYEPGWEPQI